MYVRNLTSAAVLVLILCSALLAQPRCSAGSLTGTWAYTAIGWTVPAGESTAAPTTMIGILVIDYAGKVSGPGTSTSGAPIPGTPIPAGQPLDFEMVDTSIEVNADCTGLFKYSILLKGLPVPAIGPYVDRLIVNPNQDEIWGMGVQSPISKPMWVYTLKRISHVPASVSWPATPDAK